MDLPTDNLALLLILAGPTGTGKSTLCDAMTGKYPRVHRVITSTTRPPREGEADGRDYFFFTEEAFEEKLRAKAFYETARVHGYRYGTLKSEIQAKLSKDIDLIMNIDVQGVAAFQRAAEEDPVLKQRLVTIFILPPSLEEIERRLIGRGKESAGEIARRLETARREMLLWKGYDFCFTSGRRDEDFATLECIWKSEKWRVARHLA